MALRILTPLLVLGGCLGIGAYLMATRPEPQMRRPPRAELAVEAIRLQPRDYRVKILSQGSVKARTESTLKPEVSGRVLSISPSFREGGFFEKDEVLLTIDPRDYETAVTVAEATLALKQSELELENAQHEQAKENWALLGDGTDPSPLTLREPQYKEAQADIASAAARLEEARRDLARTEIRAPYAGRIHRKEVDVGQYVAPGNELASVFAIDYVEVRLPLANEYLDYIDLPEEYRGDSTAPGAAGPPVTLRGTYGSREVTWFGRIVRAEGAYDARSRELYVVAQVDDPYARRGDRPPLKVGQFVWAEIQGKLLQNVFVIPRSAVRGGREVLMIDDRNRIRRREIQPLCKDEESVVLKTGLEAGEVLCATPVLFAADGAKVDPRIDGETRQRPERGPAGLAGPPGKRPPAAEGSEQEKRRAGRPKGES